MVTAETAVVLPVLVLLALVAVAAIGVAQARVRCADAAREAARSAARGDPVPTAHRIDLAVTRQGETELASARLSYRPVGWLPAVTIVETADAAVEPGSP